MRLTGYILTFAAATCESEGSGSPPRSPYSNIKYTAAAGEHCIHYRGTPDCPDPSRTSRPSRSFRPSRSIDRLTAASGPALSLTQHHGDGQLPIPNEKHVSGKQCPDGPDWPLAGLAAHIAKSNTPS
jgi:hypothetical protein